MKYILRRIAFVGGFGGAILVLLAALVLDLGLGKEVLMIAPHDPTLVKLNRSLYMPGDAVPDLYGNPLSEQTRVVLPASDRLVSPTEDPVLVLLQVDKLAGENPLQAKTVWYLARFLVAGFVLVGLVGFVLPKGRAGTPL
jgi:hypothetical protein